MEGFFNVFCILNPLIIPLEPGAAVSIGIVTWLPTAWVQAFSVLPE